LFPRVVLRNTLCYQAVPTEYRIKKRIFRGVSYSYSCSFGERHILTSMLSGRVVSSHVCCWGGRASYFHMWPLGGMCYSHMFFRGLLYSQIRSSETPHIITCALLRHVVFSRSFFSQSPVFRSTFLHEALNCQHIIL
jgi:hypothetical protein